MSIPDRRGRPVSEATIKTQAMRRKFMERFEKVADRAFDALEDLALGVVVVEGKREDGKPNIYRRAPDRDALKQMVEQGIGKPQQNVDLDVKGETRYVIVRAGHSGEIAQPPQLSPEDEAALLAATEDSDAKDEE